MPLPSGGGGVGVYGERVGGGAGAAWVLGFGSQLGVEGGRRRRREGKVWGGGRCSRARSGSVVYSCPYGILHGAKPHPLPSGATCIALLPISLALASAIAQLLAGMFLVWLQLARCCSCPLPSPPQQQFLLLLLSMLDCLSEGEEASSQAAPVHEAPAPCCLPTTPHAWHDEQPRQSGGKAAGAGTPCAGEGAARLKLPPPTCLEQGQEWEEDPPPEGREQSST